MTKHRNHYLDSEREDAVELARKIGTREASRQLGISYSTLCTWRRAVGEKKPYPATLEQDNKMLQEQVHRLWEVNRQLQKVVDYLLKNIAEKNKEE